MTSNPYAPPGAEPSARVSPAAAPPLWNPEAAAGWSLVFTPIFGAILHRRNWLALGEPEKAAQQRAWIFATAMLLLLTIALSVLLPEAPGVDIGTRVAGLAILLGWYFSVAKAQRLYVEARYGKTYPRKSWLQPLLLGVLGVGAFLALVFVIAVLVVLMTGAVPG
jgi:uncharacterized membrane protein